MGCGSRGYELLMGDVLLAIVKLKGPMERHEWSRWRRSEGGDP
jgi:hypothetical protein